MGKHNERFIMILDIDKVFSARELAMVEAGQGEMPEKKEEETTV